MRRFKELSPQKSVTSKTQQGRAIFAKPDQDALALCHVIITENYNEKAS